MKFHRLTARSRLLHPVPGLVLGAMLVAWPAFAQQATSDPGEDNVPEVEIMKNSRVLPQLDEAVGHGGKPLTGADGKAVDRFQQPAAKDGVQPSSGLELLDRMGASLPDLPPEKPFTGKVDDAYGAYQRGLYLTAMDLAFARAQLGDPAAQTLMAELLAGGLGVKRDPAKAAFWYEKAAEGGDPSAMFKYALILMEGGIVKRDVARADQLMQKSAEAGNAFGEFNWAQILVSKNPGEKGLRDALPFYERAAEQGVSDAQYAVSQIYLNLPDIPAEKRKRAREWLFRAARAGYDTAQFDAAVWLINGIEGPIDLEKGFGWMKLAANNGNIVAQNKLSHLYINAIGTRPDPVEATKWYVLSRRGGLKDPELEDFFLGISLEHQKAGIDAANKFRRS